MTARIHLVRHAESEHNVDQDFSRIDPELTPLGTEQATTLGQTFPHLSKVSLVITSPLRRAVQTTLHAFTNILDKRYYADGSGNGIEHGAELLVDANLQERSALPCDTGSNQSALEAAFPHLDFSTLPSGWPSKDGFYSAEDSAVHDRARKVRNGLRERVVALKDNERRDIVVVTHGVFMKFLSSDPAIDLPKAGWKSYTIEEDDEKRAVFITV